MLALPAFAQELPSLNVRAAQQIPDGVDRVLKFTVANEGDRAAMARGRVVVINVYSTSLPFTLPLEETAVPGKGTADLAVRWHDAPIFGQIRATVILNEGTPNARVASYSFWLLPNGALAGGGAAVLFASIAIVHLLMRPREGKEKKTVSKKEQRLEKALPKPKPVPVPKEKPLGSVLAYQVEPDDSVMTLSARFDVSWQEIARVNHLKPPYTLQPGKTIRIPRHPLKPPATQG
jgi:LysM repeat protein